MALWSCRSNKDLVYFTDLTSESGVISSTKGKIRLEPYDELFISVGSEISTATEQFNMPLVSPISNATVSGGAIKAEKGAPATGEQRLQTYVVDTSGDIDFPVLGKLHVAGMTTEELKEDLVKRIGETVTDPRVKVVLLNFKVNVMGEVRSPQTVNVSREKFSVLDALAACGDMSDYGIRTTVLVIREDADGEMHYQRLNLGDSKVFESPYFYLKQNDIVYVEPNSVKLANSKYNSNNSFKLSVVSTIVGVASVIASLVIALTVK